MKKTNLLAILLILALLLTGCSAAVKSNDMAMAETEVYSAPSAPMPEPEMPAEDAVVEEVEWEFSTTDTAAGGSMTVEQVQDFSDKIIYSGNVYMETTAFDQALLALDQAVKECGGFVQDSGVHGSTHYHDDGTTTVVNRYGYFTVRIPSDRFDAFMNLAGTIGNVTSSSRTAENVTSQYTDYEARLSSLYTQEERLLKMLEESGDLESLITLEARLSEVRYEIESIERSLRDLNQRLSYSTVSLELHEVEIYTPTKPVQRTFGEKLADAFEEGWEGFSRGLQSFAVGVVYLTPTLVLLAVLAVAVIVVVVKVRKTRKARKAEAVVEEETE